MVIRNGIRSILRSGKLCFLFFLLTAAVSLLLVSGSGIYVSSSAQLASFSATYQTVGRIEYIGSEYPDENALDSYAEEAYGQLSLNELEKTAGVLRAEKKNIVKGYTEGFHRYKSQIPYKNYGVLILTSVHSPTMQEETVYLDRNGDRVDCAEGYARVKVSYMSGGGVTSASYYDHNNNLVMVPALGYAQVKNDYRGNTLTKTTYLDENRNPVDVPAGYAVMIQSVNKKNKVTGIRFEHADGSPAMGPDGWAVLDRELDRKNREISVGYYDLDGQLMDPGLGYATQTRTWESDTVCVIRRFDAQGQQIPMGNGYMALRQETNKTDLVIKETFLGEDGSPKENAEGIASRVYTYDKEGQLTETRYYSAGGAPVSKDT